MFTPSLFDVQHKTCCGEKAGKFVLMGNLLCYVAERWYLVKDWELTTATKVDDKE